MLKIYWSDAWNLEACMRRYGVQCLSDGKTARYLLFLDETKSESNSWTLAIYHDGEHCPVPSHELDPDVYFKFVPDLNYIGII